MVNSTFRWRGYPGRTYARSPTLTLPFAFTSSFPPFAPVPPNACTVPLACKVCVLPRNVHLVERRQPVPQAQPQRPALFSSTPCSFTSKSFSSAVPLNAIGLFSGPLTVTTPPIDDCALTVPGLKNSTAVRYRARQIQLRLCLIVAASAASAPTHRSLPPPGSTAPCRAAVSSLAMQIRGNIPDHLAIHRHARPALPLAFNPGCSIVPFASATKLAFHLPAGSPWQRLELRKHQVVALDVSMHVLRLQVVSAVARDVHPVQQDRTGWPQNPAPSPQGSPSRSYTALRTQPP